MVPKRPAPKGPKLIHGYTPLIGPEAWLSTMGKMQMFSTSRSVFYPLPHPQIRTSAFYHRPQWFCLAAFAQVPGLTDVPHIMAWNWVELLQ